jgi:hypothetical protein
MLSSLLVAVAYFKIGSRTSGLRIMCRDCSQAEEQANRRMGILPMRNGSR